MKKIIISLVALLFILLVVFYYNSSTKSESSNDTLKTEELEVTSNLIEVEGIIGDGTSMNEIEVINEKGDTILITFPDELVKGDITPGNRVNVIYYTNEDENLASTVVNISNLCHLWSTKNDGSTQSLELNPGGNAITYNSKVDYSKWELKNGSLILKKSKPIGSEQKEECDTFDIMKLTDSELVLMLDEKETVYELEN